MAGKAERIEETLNAPRTCLRRHRSACSAQATEGGRRAAPRDATRRASEIAAERASMTRDVYASSGENDGNVLLQQTTRSALHESKGGRRLCWPSSWRRCCRCCGRCCRRPALPRGNLLYNLRLLLHRLARASLKTSFFVQSKVTWPAYIQGWCGMRISSDDVRLIGACGGFAPPCPAGAAAAAFFAPCCCGAACCGAGFAAGFEEPPP